MHEKYEKHFSIKNIIKYMLLTATFIIISIISLLFIFNQLGKNVSFSDIHIFTSKTIGCLCILLLIFFTLDGLRLFYILKTLNVNLKFKYIFKLVFINIFVCNITPFNAGGAFAQIYLLNKKKVPIGKAAAAISLRAILASTFFIIAIPFAMLITQGTITVNSYNKFSLYLPLIIVLYVAYIIGLLKLLKHNKILKTITYKTIKFFYKKKKITYRRFKNICKSIFNQIDIFSYNFIMFFNGKLKHIIMSFVITLCYFFVLFYFSVVLIRGLNYNIPSLKIIASQIVVNFIMYFGFTPGASGFAEGSYTYLFSKFVSQFELIALTFYWRLFTVYIGAAIGFILFYREIFKRMKTNKKSA